MALIVEDGTGLSTAESYLSVADFKAYCDAYGHSYAGEADAQIEQALRRATVWIDARFGVRFGGMRIATGQALVLPQSGLYDRGGFAVVDDAVPTQVERATAEAAVRELASPGSLLPDVVPGKVKKRVKVDGAVEVEYAVGTGGAASQTPVLSVIDGIMAPLFSAIMSPYQSRAVRG